MENRRNIVWLLGGGYLIYLGYQLIRDSIVEKPDKAPMFIAFAVLFIFVGGVALYRSIKGFMAKNRVDEEEDVKETESDEAGEESQERLEAEESAESPEEPEAEGESEESPEEIEAQEENSKESEE